VFISLRRTWGRIGCFFFTDDGRQTSLPTAWDRCRFSQMSSWRWRMGPTGPFRIEDLLHPGGPRGTGFMPTLAAAECKEDFADCDRMIYAVDY